MTDGDDEARLPEDPRGPGAPGAEREGRALRDGHFSTCLVDESSTYYCIGLSCYISIINNTEFLCANQATNSQATSPFPARERTAAGPGTTSVRVELDAEGRWTPAPTCGRRVCSRSPAEKHAHVVQTARRAAAEPVQVGGHAPGPQERVQVVLARLGRGRPGCRGACLPPQCLERLR